MAFNFLMLAWNNPVAAGTEGDVDADVDAADRVGVTVVTTVVTVVVIVVVIVVMVVVPVVIVVTHHTQDRTQIEIDNAAGNQVEVDAGERGTDDFVIVVVTVRVTVAVIVTLIVMIIVESGGQQGCLDANQAAEAEFAADTGAVGLVIGKQVGVIGFCLEDKTADRPAVAQQAIAATVIVIVIIAGQNDHAQGGHNSKQQEEGWFSIFCKHLA